MKETYRCATEGANAPLRLVCCGELEATGCTCAPHSVTPAQRKRNAAAKDDPATDIYGLRRAARRAEPLPLLRGSQPDGYRIEEGLAKIGRQLGDSAFPVPRRPPGKSKPPHACAYGLDRREVA